MDITKDDNFKIAATNKIIYLLEDLAVELNLAEKDHHINTEEHLQALQIITKALIKNLDN